VHDNVYRNNGCEPADLAGDVDALFAHLGGLPAIV
jgi:hypothetical protein